MQKVPQNTRKPQNYVLFSITACTTVCNEASDVIIKLKYPHTILMIVMVAITSQLLK